MSLDNSTSVSLPGGDPIAAVGAAMLMVLDGRNQVRDAGKEAADTSDASPKTNY